MKIMTSQQHQQVFSLVIGFTLDLHHSISKKITLTTSEAYLEPTQKSTMEPFCKNRSIIDLRLGSEYASVHPWRYLDGTSCNQL